MPGYTNETGPNVVQIEKKVLPSGIPMLILKKPHKWKAADYKVRLTWAHLLYHLHMCIDSYTLRSS